MIRILGTVFAALAGLAFGSFLNVFVTRWPEGESVVRPRSHCRNCDHALAWWENIPLISWVALRGRCRACREWIGWRYPIVEAVLGALWAFAFWRLSAPAQFPEQSPVVLYAAIARIVSELVFYWLLVALAALDAENLWLPNLLTLPGIVLGLAYAMVMGALGASDGSMKYGAWRALAGQACAIAIAAGFMLLTRWLYWLFRRREGLGLGDVKLMAMLAAWLGLSDAFVALLLAALLGTLAAITLLIAPARRRGSAAKWATTPLPFGTFLSIGGIVSSLWGSQMVAAYLHWAGF
jgi:leader peptidase (prepilin peptidase)/N-methyltransferase